MYLLLWYAWLQQKNFWQKNRVDDQGKSKKKGFPVRKSFFSTKELFTKTQKTV